MLKHFPVAAPRPQQVEAMNFATDAIAKGFKHVVLALPTGCGKSFCGVAACNWAASSDAKIEGEFEPGGYYLVHQKLLQDQIEHDFPRFLPGTNHGCSLKTSSEYPCSHHIDCGIGGSLKKRRRCDYATCSYKVQKGLFLNSPIALTNYSYLLTERGYVGQLANRKVLVLDEAHGLERLILRFVDLTISEALRREWAPTIRIPVFPSLDAFVDWTSTVYLPAISSYHDALDAASDEGDDGATKEAAKLLQHISKTDRAIKAIQSNPHDWIYWSEEDADGLPTYIARPLEAGPFSDLLLDAGAVRIYMSAYVGSKRSFCRQLGIPRESVAWLELGSPFPIENRRVYAAPVGSMSRANVDASLPAMIRILTKVLEKHRDEKGLVHCGSYKLGRATYEALRSTFGTRLLFPQKAADRETMFDTHRRSDAPTVLLSPSMTEGFSFDDDLARWQVIMKCPYPSLGDKQVRAKLDRDREWYQLQAVSTIVQAAGRIVRNDTDHGETYIFDKDFERLYGGNEHLFPAWFREALVWK